MQEDVKVEIPEVQQEPMQQQRKVENGLTEQPMNDSHSDMKVNPLQQMASYDAGEGRIAALILAESVL